MRPSSLVREKYLFGDILCLHLQDVRVLLNFDIGYRVLQAIRQHSRRCHEHQHPFTMKTCHILSEADNYFMKGEPVSGFPTGTTG
jgi:hypothetical protein